MTIYSLYVKTHNQTGLKYLGQTTQNPKKYKGSGIRWTNHLNSHGNDVSTEIIGQYKTKEELKEMGLYFSKLWNVVESDEFANLKEEAADGGAYYESAEQKEKRCQKLKEWNAIHRPKKMIICLECDTEFHSQGGAKFCCRKCASIYQQKSKGRHTLNTVCAECNIPIRKSHHEFNNYPIHFCCKSHQAKWYSKNKIFRNHR